MVLYSLVPRSHPAFQCCTFAGWGLGTRLGVVCRTYCIVIVAHVIHYWMCINCFRCKYSKKKHKKWEGDGELLHAHVRICQNFVCDAHVDLYSNSDCPWSNSLSEGYGWKRVSSNL